MLMDEMPVIIDEPGHYVTRNGTKVRFTFMKLRIEALVPFRLRVLTRKAINTDTMHGIYPASY